MVSVLRSLLILFLLVLKVSPALAHGSVVAGDDLCVIRIGFYSAHFKIFQPQTSASKEFCEDLPTTGESIFVMEYLHQTLAEVPIEFRIIKNTTGLGNFTKLADVQAITDLDAVTVFHQQPLTEKDVFTIRHAFAEEGDFLGVVIARHPVTEAQYMAVFPFHVGKVSWGWLPWIAALALLAQLGFWFANGTLKRWSRHWFPVVTTLFLLVLFPHDALTGELHTSEQGWYRVSMESNTAPVPLNQMHSWIIHLETAGGEPVENAKLQLEGGMPEHNHGLPTIPVVTRYLGSGNYQLDGVRFHMMGNWLLTLTIELAGKQDKVMIPFTL